MLKNNGKRPRPQAKKYIRLLVDGYEVVVRIIVFTIYILSLKGHPESNCASDFNDLFALDINTFFVFVNA